MLSPPAIAIQELRTELATSLLLVLIVELSGIGMVWVIEVGVDAAWLLLEVAWFLLDGMLLGDSRTF